MNQLRLTTAQLRESSGQGLRLGRFLDGFLILLIIGNVVAIVFESVQEIAAAHGRFFGGVVPVLSMS